MNRTTKSGNMRCVATIRDSGMPAAPIWERFFDPEAILDVLGCTNIRGDALEFGCGYGTFTIEVGRRVTGTVYGLDIDRSMVAVTRERASSAGLTNIVAEERDFVHLGSGRPDESVSFALLFNILHLEEPIPLLQEVRRVLRPGGRCAVIHWRRDPATPRGPPPAIRPDSGSCRAWAEKAGLQFVAAPELPRTPWHWGMLMKRPDPTVRTPT